MNVQDVLWIYVGVTAPRYFSSQCNMGYWIISLCLYDIASDTGCEHAQETHFLVQKSTYISNLIEAYRLQIVIKAPMALGNSLIL